MEKNIFLIGFRGAGKSTIANGLIANHYTNNVHPQKNIQMISTDHLIIEYIKTDIATYVANNGWQKFRFVEEKLSLQLAKKIQATKKTSYIIDFGGGIVENERIINAFKPLGKFWFIDTPLRIILKRLSADDGERPLLVSLQKEKNLTTNLIDNSKIKYQERLPWYRKYADCILQTKGKTIAACTDEIKKNLLK